MGLKWMPDQKPNINISEYYLSFSVQNSVWMAELSPITLEPGITFTSHIEHMGEVYKS